MTRSVGIGVVGMGWMGEAHSRAYNAVRDRFHHDDTKAIEAYQFLESITTGVQGEPGFREAAAVARVQEAIMRSWASERWEPVASEE